MPLDLLEHFTIRCGDMEKTRDFYRDVLGLPVGEGGDALTRTAALDGTAHDLRQIVRSAPRAPRTKTHPEGGVAHMQ